MFGKKSSNKIMAWIGLIMIGLSLVLPFVLSSPNSKKLFSEVLEGLALICCITAIITTLIVLNKKKKRKRRSVLIMSNIDGISFSRQLENLLLKRGYNCSDYWAKYYQAFSNGGTQKQLDIDNIAKKSDSLIIVLSQGTSNLVNIEAVIKAFKRKGKLIQIYSLGEINLESNLLKSYLVLPLNGSEKDNLLTIVIMLNRAFVGIELRRKN